MKTRSSFHPLSLVSAFKQFLKVSSFVRRTRESYAEDLAPLLAEAGQQPVTALTTDVLHAFLARQESLAPATYNRRLAALRSFTRELGDQGGGPLRSSKVWIGSRMRNGWLARKTPRSVESVLREREDPHRRNIPQSSSRITIALHQTSPSTHGLRNEMHLSRKRALIVLRGIHGFCDSSGIAPTSPPSKRCG